MSARLWMLLMVCLGMLSFPTIGGAADIVLPPTFFDVGGHQAFILRPTVQTGPVTPWVWYAPTFKSGYPDVNDGWYIQKLLDHGIAVAGVDVGESYGSPAGRATYSEFYTYATSHGLASKACLLGRSRGGLMVYNWAAENPDKVSGIAGIYPACDLRSYPGLATAAPAYGMTAQQLEQHLSENNPIDRLAPLAQAGIPLFSIHGDSDTVVPLSQNSQVVYNRYIALGGKMTLVVVPGKGHEVAPEFHQSEQLANFLIAHAQVPEPSSAVLLGAAAVWLLAYAWRKRN